MPYSLAKRGGRWCVTGPDGVAVPGGCHDARRDALAHQRALMVNVPEAHSAALADVFPLDPPAEWFSAMPEWFRPGMKGTLMTEGPEAGRYAATVAPQNQCILSGRELDECWMAPPSPSAYAAAMQGDTVLDDGRLIQSANIGGGVNHAGRNASFVQARDHYANSASAMLRVCYYDVDGYTVALGAAWPELSDRDVRMVASAALSGDWRWRRESDAYDMAGSQFVLVPGLPLMDRPGLRLAFQPRALAASLDDPHPAIVGGWTTTEETDMPEPSLTLTLTASEAARLHELLTAPQSASAGCTCGQTAAPPIPPNANKAPAPSTNAPPAPTQVDPTHPDATVSRQEFDALVARVEVLEQDDLDDDLAEVDGIMAALPEPLYAPEPEPYWAAAYNADQLKALAAKGQVFNKDDLNYPIGNCQDVSDAAQAVGRGASGPDEVAARKAYIIKTAKKINCAASLPQDWQDQKTPAPA